MDPGALSIGGLARRTDCKVETIRYYERIGLLAPPRRGPGGHRIYAEDDARRLGLIRRSRALGFTLQEVRTLLQLVDGAEHTCADVRALAGQHLAAVRAKLADLQRLERSLAGLVESCRGDAAPLPDCPIIDALSSEAARDSAPAYPQAVEAVDQDVDHQA